MDQRQRADPQPVYFTAGFQRPVGGQRRRRRGRAPRLRPAGAGGGPPSRRALLPYLGEAAGGMDSLSGAGYPAAFGGGNAPGAESPRRGRRLRQSLPESAVHAGHGRRQGGAGGVAEDQVG